MNETISTQLAHRSIRQFTDQPVGEETMGTLFDVAMAAPTSRGFQHAGIIRIKSPELRQELARIGTQPYIADAPELMVFIVDTRRNYRILEEQGLDTSVATSADVFREGFTDALLMAQNLAVAAESLGLGVCYLGSVLNDYVALIKALKLPAYTFPVVGLMLGHPNQEPQLKPRMPKQMRVMEDTYSEPESWMATLTEYDAEMHTYYDLRDANNRVDEFTTQVARKLQSRPSRDLFFEHVVNQGFDVK